MKPTKTIYLALLLSLFLGGNAFAQSDLQIFGFFQFSINKLNGGYDAIADVNPAFFGTSKLTLDSKHNNYLSPSNQQLNLFLRKELDQNFTAWVNLEIVGSYNSGLKWGNLSLEEAWVNYQNSDAFNIKAGLLIPRFAYLNEIKNRMPLLPYITRPLVYESNLQDINQANYIPERAFVQIYGYIPLGSVTFDYAAFAGPSERTYITSSGAIGGNSVDTTNFKLFGGRVGLKYNEFRLGVSATFDKNNQQATIKEDVSRTRIAFDLGYNFYNFFFDGEYISVHLTPDANAGDMDKLFYYGTLGYNFSEQVFAYGSYSYLKDEGNNILKAGMKGIIVGLGYRPTSAVVLKAGYSNYNANSSFPTVLSPVLPPANTTVDLNVDAFQFAVSILF